MENQAPPSHEDATVEAIAKSAATKMFKKINEQTFGQVRFDLSNLAREAIVSAYREGLDHGYKFVVPPTEK